MRLEERGWPHGIVRNAHIFMKNLTPVNTPEVLHAGSARRVVAIPVKNEAEHILPCLRALAAQVGGYAFDVLLLLNNCTDKTARIVQEARPGLPFALHVRECELSPALASAGHARKLAMQHAARLAGLHGVLLTTDADSRVAPNWIAANVEALADGADAVAGQAEIDADDAANLPRHLLEAEERVQLLTDMLDEIAWRLDPDPADPRPRHVQHSGASIAVTAEIYYRAGGIPDIAVAEDRAFFRALQRIDARIRHCPQARVTVSGRIHGRAKDGMADTIRRRMVKPDAWLDDCLEPVADAVRRAHARAVARELWADSSGDIEAFAQCLHLPVSVVRQCLAGRTFGATWQDLEARSVPLQRRLIPADDLNAEIARAVETLLRIKAPSCGMSSVFAATTSLADAV